MVPSCLSTSYSHPPYRGVLQPSGREGGAAYYSQPSTSRQYVLQPSPFPLVDMLDAGHATASPPPSVRMMIRVWAWL